MTPTCQVRVEGLRHGSRNPDAWRRKALSEDQVLAANMVNHPLTQYMVCFPGEGAVALVLARGARIRELARTPVYLGASRSARGASGRSRSSTRTIAIESAPSATTATTAAAFEAAGIGPEDVDVAQVQDAESGAEVVHLVETGLCEQGAGGADPTRSDQPHGPAAGHHRRRLPGQRQADRCVEPAAGARGRPELRCDAGNRQIPGPRRVGFTKVYCAPGVSACAILTV